MKHKVTMQFPSLLMIPVFSVIGVILKLLGLSVYSWTMAVLTLPIVFYFAWCIGYCMLAILGMAIVHLYDKFTK